MMQSDYTLINSSLIASKLNSTQSVDWDLKAERGDKVLRYIL